MFQGFRVPGLGGLGFRVWGFSKTACGVLLGCCGVELGPRAPVLSWV